jgi:signal transduction histidine kinase
MAGIYNQMMTTLGNQNLALEKSHDTLETEVTSRTKELVVARDAALTASRLKSEFLANISHELRTPLQAIIGYTDLVREDLELECMTVQAEDLNKSIRSAHVLLALINNILDLAKIEAGKMELNVKSVDIKQLIDETIETIKPMADANENQLLIENTIDQRILNLDRQKVMQILLNLLSNACKFTAKGRITFTVYNDDKFLYLSIADTGVGIPKDKLEFIFDKFTQIDGSQTRKFEGTGLGMAITQKFCALMLGELTIDSELTVGTTVKVIIPIN